MAIHCQFYTKQLVGWVEPPGPAYGRPDDKLRGWARICPALKRYPSVAFCEDDRSREEINPSCALVILAVRRPVPVYPDERIQSDRPETFLPNSDIARVILCRQPG